MKKVPYKPGVIGRYHEAARAYTAARRRFEMGAGAHLDFDAVCVARAKAEEELRRSADAFVDAEEKAATKRWQRKRERGAARLKVLGEGT